MLEEAIHIDVDTNAGEAEKKFDSLKSKLKAMQAELGKLKEGSPAFIELAKKAGELQDKIEGVRNSTKFFADDTRQLQGVIGTLETVTAGFGAIQGAQALLGAESEELQQILTKVNATMLILNGLQSIQANLQKDSAAYIFVTTTAQTLYDKALKASTLSQTAFNVALGGVVAIGVAAVIAAIVLAQDDLTEANKLAIKYQNDYNEALQKSKLDIEAEKVVLLQKLAIAKDETQSLKTREEALRQIKKEQPEYFENLTIETINTKAATVAVENYTKAMTQRALVMAAEGQLIEIGKELLTIEQERAAAAQERQKAIQATPETVVGKIAQIEYDFKVKIDALNQRDIAAKDRLGVLQGIITKNAADFLKLETDAFPVAKKLADETERTQQAVERLSTAVGSPAFDKFLKVFGKNPDLTSATDQKILGLFRYTQAVKQSNDEILKSGELADKGAEEFNRRAKVRSDNALERERNTFEGRLEIYRLTADGFGSLSQLLQSEGKKQNDVQKALAIVQIAIDTAVALSTALAKTYRNTPEPIVAAIRYATVAAQILSASNQIKNVLKGGGSAGVSNGSAPSAPTGNTTQTAQPTQPASPVIQNTITITERDLRRAAINAAERNRGAVVVV